MLRGCLRFSVIWVVAFYLVQLGCTAFAAWRGGSPERIAGLALLSALIATTWVPATTAGYQAVYWPIVWVDLCLFAALVTLALLADRFWPIWLSALQLLALSLHGVRAYDPTVLPYAYWLVIGKIGYVMVLVLVVGTARHARRVREHGSERAWSVQRLTDEQAIAAGQGRP